MSGELWRWDAVELARGIRLRTISSREAVRAVLDRLEKVNPALRAVTVVLAEPALADADRADAARARGGRYREDLCLDAAEVIEARCALSTPIDPR